MHQSPPHAVALFAVTEKDVASHQEQQTFMRDFAHAHDFCLVGFFAIEPSDAARSVTHAVKLALCHGAHHLIVDELATLALTRAELMDVLTSLNVHGLALIFVKEACTFELSQLQAMKKLLLISEEADKQLRSATIKKALHRKKRKGSPLGGRKFGVGAEESLILRQITKLRDEGKSLQTICAMLEQNRIQSTHGKKWHPTTVKRILERNNIPLGSGN